MRIGLDATPLLGVRTGVGRYVEHLLGALAASPAAAPPPGAPAPGARPSRPDPLREELVATAFTLRGAGRLPAMVPPRVRVRHLPLPARGLHELWARTELPTVEWLVGPVDVFHATNFVLPPVHRAAGVVTVHDLSYLRTPAAVSAASLRYQKLVPRSLRRAAIVCTPSAAVAAELGEQYRLPAERVVVTPLGVDEAWFTARPPDRAWLAAHRLPERYLLFVGSVEPRKGLPTLLQAYRALRAHDRAAPPLVLAGPPGWGPALDTAGLPATAVLSAGYLATDDLRSVVAGAACLAFPSRYEGFGLPPLEALATGTPVVASDLPVSREVLGDQASLVPVGDVDALAGALAAALAEDEDTMTRSAPARTAAASSDPSAAPAVRRSASPAGPADGSMMSSPASTAARAARVAHARRFTWAACAAATREAYRRGRAG